MALCVRGNRPSLLRRATPVAALGLAAGLGAVETLVRRHPGNALELRNEGWTHERKDADHLRIGGRVVAHNLLEHREVMLVDVRPQVHLLSRAALDGVVCDVSIVSHEPRAPTRADGYWTAYVVKPGHYHHDSTFELVVDVSGPAPALDELTAAWIDVSVDTYGFEGRVERHHPIVVPLAFPDLADSPPWRGAEGGCQVRPVRTHLLCPLDDPLEVVRRYALPLARPGDIVTIGESPLAVMQGRFHDPRNLKVGWLAPRVAQFMSGEGSLGTSPGMAALLGEVGGARVVGALVGGAIGKAVGQAGWFYRLAGPRSKLIDDVTGTLPPYDNFIVLGPDRADELCAEIQAATGLAAAVVDANDLGRVDVVGASQGVSAQQLEAALRANPAGNGEETTPLVLVRPGP